MEGHCLVNNWYVEDVYEVAAKVGRQRPSKDIAILTLKIAAKDYNIETGINSLTILRSLIKASEQNG